MPPLTLYQPMMSSHKLVIIYMGGLILGINTLYRLFCFFKLFPVVCKGLKPSLVEGKPETLEKILPGKQLVGLEPTTSHSVVN